MKTEEKASEGFNQHAASMGELWKRYEERAV